MRIMHISAVSFVIAAVFAAGCIRVNDVVESPFAGPGSGLVLTIEPGPNAYKAAQAALINARPGDIVEFGAGRFDFRSTLSLDVSHVTIRGQGPDKTILSFKDQGQGTGGEGLLVTSKENVTIQDLAVEDAKGDAIKVQRNQADRLPQRPHRVDRRSEGDQRRLRPLSRALHRRADRGLHGRSAPPTPASTSASRRTSSFGATRPRRTWPASRSRTRSAPTSTTTWPPTTPAASWSSPCPTCPRRMATTAASSQHGARQQPRELRPQGEHRGERPAGHRHHDHGQRPGRGLRQHGRAEPDRAASRSSAT